MEATLLKILEDWAQGHPRPIPFAELTRIKEALETAYKAGRDIGYSNGNVDGYSQGYEDGHEDCAKELD